jgi:deazaflavin-dependent oxidoreductase (nitroreductase family)
VVLDVELARRPVCVLETIGRTSGQPRQIEIWFAADIELDRIYFLSGGRDRAHWVRNIRRDGRVRIRIGERWFAGRAREVGAGPEDERARRLVAGKYEAWREGRSLSAWARTSLPVAVDLRVPPG